MKKFYKIDAVHDILKRVIETNLNDKEMVKLYKELQNAGYEDKNILLDTVREIYEEGDTIMITKEMFDALPEEKDIDRSKDGWIELHKKAEAKNSIRYIYGDKPHFPIVGVLEKFRTNREHEHLIVKWTMPKDEQWNGTNVYFLEGMGFEFKQPESTVIPIDESPDDMLSDHDLVIKYMMLENSWSEKACETYLAPVLNAMQRAGAVFYRP